MIDSESGLLVEAVGAGNKKFEFGTGRYSTTVTK